MSRTFVFPRFDVTAGTVSNVQAELSIVADREGDWVPAQDAIDREAVLQAQIRTLETQLKDARAAAGRKPVEMCWRELCRRLYVELYACDQQMRQTFDENGKPMWLTGATVRDVLRDVRWALENQHAPQS